MNSSDNCFYIKELALQADSNQMNFHFTGNHIAVDFVNTQFLTPTEWVDQLHCSDAFKEWLESAYGDDSITCNHRQMRDVIDVRRTLKRVFEKIVSSAAIDNEELTKINLWSNRLTQVLSAERGNFKVTAVVRTGEDALAQIAHSACQLLTSAEIKSLLQCEYRNCHFFFVDTSRGQQRKWCTKNGCGNRSRSIRQHRKRQRENSTF